MKMPGGVPVQPGENREQMHPSSPAKKRQTPLDDARDSVIPDALRLMRTLRHSPNGFIQHTENRSAAIAALHSAGLVDLMPSRFGMIISRRAAR